jgi:hypothetical protein
VEENLRPLFEAETNGFTAPFSEVSRRQFVSAAAGAGLALALPQALAARASATERRTLFFNLSNEDHEGHSYYLVAGKQRYPLNRTSASVLKKARRSNKVLQSIPDAMITHVIENVELPVSGVTLSYTIKDPDLTSGTWSMSSLYLLPAKASFVSAFKRLRKGSSAGLPLALSAKRRKYGLEAASTLPDLLDELDLLDSTDWATAMVNLHPETLCFDGTAAAAIQATHIHPLGATNQLAEVLEVAGPAAPQLQPGEENQEGWATLVPYTDDDGVTPLRNTTGNNKGLILYDTSWQPKLTPFLGAALKPALRGIKNDTSLGVDVTAGTASLTADELTGKIWNRNDGVASIDQSAGSVNSSPGSDNAKFILSNLTPKQSGYSVSAKTTIDGGVNVGLTCTNWYLRWLGLYVKFYDAAGNPVDKNNLPLDISQFPDFDTADSEIFLGILTPEFTVFGIPVSNSIKQAAFTFPTGVAASAKILASGLGYGSHTFEDTENVGIVMTSIFNLIVPAVLICLGVAPQIDVLFKAFILPAVKIIFTEIAAALVHDTPKQSTAIFKHALAKSTAPVAFKATVGILTAFLAESELAESLADAIPLAGAILQAIGLAGALAEVTETSVEVLLSPWTYDYDLVGTHDLSIALSPDPRNPAGFPAAAATYRVTVVFDNGTPIVQFLNMPGTTVKTLPPVVFTNVPLGGNGGAFVAFYSADNTLVGHGSTGFANGLNVNPSITITEDRLPITNSTVYAHKQKTILDAAGNHAWACAAAPPVPATPSACQPNPGNLCAFRNITFNGSLGYVGYAWQSYNSASCAQNGSAQLDQIATLPSSNGSNGNAQAGYVTSPCSLLGNTSLVYDPRGRSGSNYYLDTSQGLNVLRQVELNPPNITDPRLHQAWGTFNLPADDLLLHPSGAVITINSATSRMESLKLPMQAVSDTEASVSLIANLHGGLGSRPGLFNTPAVATITAEGVVLIVESGNNRIHAVDAVGNPVRLFAKQPEPYFLSFSATGGTGTQYLDVAVEFSGFIYVLSSSNSVYRLDIYNIDQNGSDPISTTMGFNAAKLTVDYWRTVYSLNYEVLMVNGKLPPNGVTEPSISQWIPTALPPCESVRRPVRSPRASLPEHPLRRYFWKA